MKQLLMKILLIILPVLFLHKRGKKMAKLEALGFFMALLRIEYTIEQNGASEKHLHISFNSLSTGCGCVTVAFVVIYSEIMNR